MMLRTVATRLELSPSIRPISSGVGTGLAITCTAIPLIRYQDSILHVPSRAERENREVVPSVNACIRLLIGRLWRVNNAKLRFQPEPARSETRRFAQLRTDPKLSAVAGVFEPGLWHHESAARAFCPAALCLTRYTRALYAEEARIMVANNDGAATNGHHR
jgi:hypothetical protein